MVRRDRCGRRRAEGDGRRLCSQRAALRLIAPVVGVEDLNEEAADVSREAGADAETMRATMGAFSPEPVPTDASVQDTALNGAQVDAMVSLAEKVMRSARSRWRRRCGSPCVRSS